MDVNIQRGWLSYMDDVIPKDAQSVQIQECKRAFVAGAKHVLEVVTSLGDDSVSEDDGVIVLEQLHQECDAFVADVLAGKA